MAEGAQRLIDLKPGAHHAAKRAMRGQAVRGLERHNLVEIPHPLLRVGRLTGQADGRHGAVLVILSGPLDRGILNRLPLRIRPKLCPEFENDVMLRKERNGRMTEAVLILVRV